MIKRHGFLLQRKYRAALREEQVTNYFSDRIDIKSATLCRTFCDPEEIGIIMIGETICLGMKSGDVDRFRNEGYQKGG